MRAVYAIFTCESCDNVFMECIVIDVSDDPSYPANESKAVKAAGYDPDESCGNACGQAYEARFIGHTN